MTLAGSIEKLQNLGVGFYSDLAQVFSTNNLIHDTWLAMSQDLRQQIDSFQSLPHSFWSRFKDDEAQLRDSIQACLTSQQTQPEGGRTLQRSLSRALDFEEPLILKVYVPLIRRLRSEGSDQILDFYIVVKAHVSRFLQVIRSFSGDPTLIHRATSLFQGFEKEVQVPEEPPVYHARPAVASKGQAKKPHPERPKTRSVPRHPHQLGKRSIPKRRQTLIKVSRRVHR